jgi:hypothetical protein
LRQAWLTAYIYCFNQLGTAQAEACGYILQKALLFWVFCFGFLSFPSSGWGTPVGAKLQLRLMARGATAKTPPRAAVLHFY